MQFYGFRGIQPYKYVFSGLGSILRWLLPRGVAAQCTSTTRVILIALSQRAGPPWVTFTCSRESRRSTSHPPHLRLPTCYGFTWKKPPCTVYPHRYPTVERPNNHVRCVRCKGRCARRPRRSRGEHRQALLTRHGSSALGHRRSRSANSRCIHASTRPRSRASPICFSCLANRFASFVVPSSGVAS